MGLGLLGAMGGVGESVSSIGKQMYQGALDQEKMDYLAEKQKAMELFKHKLIDDERTNMSSRIAKERERLADGSMSPLHEEAATGISNMEGLTDEQRATALDAVKSNRDALRNNVINDPRTTVQAGLNTGDIAPEKAVGLLKSDDVNAVKLAVAEGRINSLKDYLEFMKDKLDREMESKDKDRATKESEGEKNRETYGGRGGKSAGNSLSQEKWDDKKLTDHIKEQTQFYAIPDIAGEAKVDPLAKSVYSSLVRKFGPEKADSVLTAAMSEAQESSGGSASGFKKDYLARINAINKRLNGLK